MKYPFLVTVAFSLLATLFGQSSGNRESADAITKIEEEFGLALIQNDAEKIGSFLADDWIVVGPDGTITDKARFLSVIQSGTLSHQNMDSQDIRVRIYGTTAIVTALISSKAKYINQEFTTRERATDVFVKRDGRWQCVITHLTTATTN